MISCRHGLAEGTEGTRMADKRSTDGSILGADEAEGTEGTRKGPPYRSQPPLPLL
jgi:hypothetical protein